MNRYLLLFALAFCMVLNAGYAGDKKNAKDDELLRKSIITEPPIFGPDQSSFPKPFVETSNPVNSPAVSTGYYFVDSDDEAPDYWRPNPDITDTTIEPNLWRRILPGPRQRDPQYWVDNPDEGLRFFRNPGLPFPTGDFFNGPTDSTDDAIAGPIPIGFNFYFNGLRFDSFYVSTNGIIALSNRRYFYDANGNRTIPPGSQTGAYDPMSMDWFDGSRSRSSATGLDDALADNYGYQYAVLGNNIMNANGGIRARGGSLNNIPNKTHVIAPFFGDLELSQFNRNTNMPEDFGRVYFKRSNSADKLIIYFINAQPIRTLVTPIATIIVPLDLRRGENGFLQATAQVTLDKRDSSVTIVYEQFEGVVTINGRGVPCNTIFRYNTAAGIRGFARHTNYGQSTPAQSPWAGEYEQHTHYFSSYQNPASTYPHNFLAVKYKQWKNTVRVVDIQYKVRKQDPNADLDFTETVPSTKANNYELLAGEERIGAIQPIAIIQNISNSIQGPQGVNFQPQQLNFRARFRILNEATGRIIYNRLVPIDSLCLALPDTATQECTGDPYVKIRYSSVVKDAAGNYIPTTLPFPGTSNLNGIPPYGFVTINFPPFEPNEFVLNHIGRLSAFIIADPTDPSTNESMKDEWPFDDTTSVRIFVMKRLIEFSDDVTEYHVVSKSPMPSVLKWVNLEAEVQAGDDVSFYPLPPRGEYAAANNEGLKLQSPVIRMDRKTLSGGEPPAYPGGDEIRSFPIDIRGKHKAVLSLSIQRHIKEDDYPRGWSDGEEKGIEPRTVINSDVFTVLKFGNAVSASSNEIAIEMAQPSPDGIQHITNIQEKRWRNHWRRGGAKPVTDMAAYTLFGAGGAMRGFLESDRDSALSQPAPGSIGGLRADLYDDGIDWEYKKIFVTIPDTIVNSPNEGAKNFRFRIKSYFYNDKKAPPAIPDDDDIYFVDNVKLLFPSEITDIEVSNVRVLWPYTLAPASQAIKVPIRVKLSNNTSVNAPTFLVKVKIYRGNQTPAPTQKPIYCRTEQLPFMGPGTEVELAMPNWDARAAGPGAYRLYANIIVPGGDLEPLNDTTYTNFSIKFGDVFAYEMNPEGPRNDVPDQSFAGIPGRGLNMFGFAYGGTGNSGGPTSGYDEQNYGAGYTGGNGSGQIAAKFQLFQPDTIYGYKAFWGPLNQAMDDIAFAVYADQGGAPSATPISGSVTYKQRGWDDIRSKQSNEAYFDQYVTYLLTKPLVLPAGIYWMTVAQLGETGFELGASKTRVGMRQTSVYIPPPITAGGAVGGAGIHLVIDKNFRKYNPSYNLINNNFFSYENTRGSGQWIQFMPTVGNPAYAHMHHFGVTPADNFITSTLTRGTWIPMIRPYLGLRPAGTNPVYQECVDDIPVEISAFDGMARNMGLSLFWETASEINNAGFYVEKKVGTSTSDEWNSIGFVKGAGKSTDVRHYDYLDKDVVANTTYSYRLRQVDKDGEANCEAYSKVVVLTYTNNGALTLEQNSPNPFKDDTKITFNLPYESDVKLEVLDVFGNVVATLVNSKLSATSHEYDWNGLDATGKPAVSGTYIYRLTAGDQTLTNKMTLVR